MTDCFLRVVREQGFVSLWRGYFVTIMRYFPLQALNFAFNSQYKKVFPGYDKTKEPLKFFMGNLSAGAAAGATSVAVFYPLDFARTRLGVDVGRNKEERQFKNFFDCFLKILKSDGIGGLYRGLMISMVLTVFYRATYFGLFDTGKAYLFPQGSSQNFLLMWIFAT